MSYVLWFGIVAILFALMHYFTELNGRQKGAISFVATLIVIGAILYNIKSDADRKHVMRIELKFNNGETVDCGNIQVNNTEFSYSIGTQSFIGHKGSRYAWQIVSARECE